MTPFMKSFLIKNLLRVLLFGLILGGVLFYINYEPKTLSPSDIKPADTTELVRQVKIIAFGDSLTSGHRLPVANSFPAELEKLLRSKGYNVVVKNFGESGDTTTQGLRRLPSVIAERPDIVIVEFGANDALKEQSMAIAQRNLYDIVQALKDLDIKVLLAGIKPPEHLAFYSKDENFFKQVAVSTGVLFYPNFMKGVFDVKNNADLVLRDRMHPSAKGTAIMAENISPYVILLLQNYLKQPAKP